MPRQIARQQQRLRFRRPGAPELNAWLMALVAVPVAVEAAVVAAV